MKSDRRFYLVIKQIHLYASLLTVAFLMMYIITSYMMIYHDWFHVEKQNKSTTSMLVTPEEINDEHWNTFIKKHQIDGRLTRENFNDSGDLIRTYSSADGNSKITIFKDKNEVEIQTTELNLSGRIIGLHRMRGYGGSFIYNFYAVMLDVVGISLMLFAITGVILWLKLLKFNKLAWGIFIFGFVYVSAVILYLLFN
jgi:hypothetical protein